MKNKTKEIIIPLTSNIAFNRVMREKEVLIPFLSDLMHRKIIDLEYLDTELEADRYNGKECRLDIRVKLEDRTYVNVEMQKTNKGDILLRLQYYMAENIYRQLKSGGEYDSIKRVVEAGILDYNDERFPNFHYIYKLTDQLGLHKVKNKLYNKEEIRKEDIEISVLEVTEVHIVNLRSEINNDERLYRWKKIFLEEESWSKMEYKDKDLQKAVEELKKLNMNEEAVRAYDLEMRIERDRISSDNYLKRKAREEGLQEGLQEGRKEGLEQGIEQGREQVKTEMAINLYQNGVSKETICNSLNLSEEQLNVYLAKVMN